MKILELIITTSITMLLSFTACEKFNTENNTYDHVIVFYNVTPTQPMGFLPAKGSKDVVLSINAGGISQLVSTGQEEYENQRIEDVDMKLPVGSNYDNVRDAFNFISENFPSHCYDLILNLGIPQFNGSWLPASCTPGCSDMFDLEQFAKACPLHFRSISLAGENMGCIENAYTLRNTCDILIADATSNSKLFPFPYVVSSLTKQGMQNYWEMVVRKQKEYSEDYAIAMIDCSKLDIFAESFESLIKATKSNLHTNRIHEDALSLSAQSEQTPYELYDLRDMLKKSGLAEDVIKSIDTLLESVIINKQSTLSGFCGISMCNPYSLDYGLKKVYSLKEWSQKTSWGN